MAYFCGWVFPSLIFKMKKTSPSDTKVLLVDDEPNILLALEFLLQREGYRVEKAFNGVQALEILPVMRPDIVVLDVMMPGMDGFEVARNIRQQPEMERTKIIFLTAKGTPTDKMKGYDTGGEYYLIKPFDNTDFVQIIQEVAAYGWF